MEERLHRETPHELAHLFGQALHGTGQDEGAFFDALLWRVKGLTAAIAPRKGVVQPERQDDLVQEVMQTFLLRLRESPERLRAIEDWDAVIARNIWWRLMDYLRVEAWRNRHEVPAQENSPHEPGATATVLAFLAQQRAGITTAERFALLDLFLNERGIEPATVSIVRRRLAGDTFAEIAPMFGLSVNACCLRYHRVNEALRAWLAARHAPEQE